jgi:hypothetical protein
LIKERNECQYYLIMAVDISIKRFKDSIATVILI